VTDSALHRLLHIGERERSVAVARKRDDLVKEAGLILCPSEILGPESGSVEMSDEATEEEIRFLSLAADQISLAVANVLHLERSRTAQSDWMYSLRWLKLLHDLTNSLVANLDLDDLLTRVTASAKRVIRSDFAIVELLDSESGRFHVNAFDLSDNAALDRESVNSLAEMLGTRVFSMGKPGLEGQTNWHRRMQMEVRIGSWEASRIAVFCHS
jgi:GAF domain-containing protein